MTLSGEHFFLAIVAAAVIVAAILWMAPSWQAGRDRLNLIVNTLGIVIVFAGWSVGIAMLVWGIAAGNKGLIYFSFMPMVLGGLTYNFITRRHRTWYGIFGFDDSRERWKSFWDETRNLWGLPRRSSAAPGGSAGSSAPRTPPGRQSAATPGRPARGFSVSFGSRGASAGFLAPIIAFAATRLATGHVTVFPNSLEFAIGLDPASNGTQPHLEAFRQTMVVRRRDGGHLQLAVRSDLAFLDATAGPRRFDGSYTIEVGLVARHLKPGPFSGSIVIDTGDPAEPQLTVPVAGVVA
ncbi:MAG TPA: hypothetical protein VMN43_10350 [Aestuariivirgaceae bacterium]|nr:hypothetical protein [Aestuariivirgaceae bacterium]